MKDPRALASIKNLDSYRKWNQEGVRRSGYLAIISIVMSMTPLLTLAILYLKPPGTRDAHTWLVATGTAFAVYLLIALGLMVFAVQRLHAWKRVHPWQPPPSPIWK